MNSALLIELLMHLRVNSVLFLELIGRFDLILITAALDARNNTTDDDTDNSSGATYRHVPEGLGILIPHEVFHVSFLEL